MWAFEYHAEKRSLNPLGVGGALKDLGMMEEDADKAKELATKNT